ncbi:MAG: hypothetical protein R2813_00985 [Flavobacteriales bacterium]
MSEIEKKHIDRYHLLEVLHHRLEGSLHSHTDVLSIAYQMGLETEYAIDLIRYLKINGYIETLGNTTIAMLTDHGLRAAIRSELAA